MQHKRSKTITLADLIWARGQQKRKLRRLKAAGVYVVEKELVAPVIREDLPVRFIGNTDRRNPASLPSLVRRKGRICGAVWGGGVYFPEDADQEAIKKQLMEYHDGTVAREIEEEIQKYHEEKKA